MKTLAPLVTHYLAVPAAPAASHSHVPLALVGAGALTLALVFMWRAAGPFLEIIKSALYAFATFLLIAVGAVLVLVTAVRG